MKNKKIHTRILFYSTLAVWCAGMFSCGNYLDVRPKSEVPADQHFERESGFQDQLTGVYTKMCQPSLYGRNLTYGLVEVLAQNYDLDAANYYYYAGLYNYTEINTRQMIDSIWTDTYNCIANLNLTLQYLDKANRNIFSGNNYEIFKGECLGLRGFLHFEMLRLFAPSYASNPEATGIPYVTEYAPKVTPHIPVREALERIIADLEEAGELLVDTDPLSAFPDSEKYYARRDYGRSQYFNYYAVIGALARAYMYKGDGAKALPLARLIIEEGEKNTGSPFSWTGYTALEATRPADNDRRYTNEQIFQLNLNKMEDNIKDYMTASAGTNVLTPSDEKIAAIFEESAGLGNDYRRRFWFQYSGEQYLFSKFWQYEASPFNNLMPVMRKTEFYYLAAEIVNATNPAEAVEILNLVRSHRAIPDLSTDLNENQVREEIFKGIRKELLGEGQLFHYYKRLNISNIEGAGMTANDALYVLPKPDNEIEFGDV